MDAQLRHEIGLQIKQAREARGLTQKQLAAEAGLGSSNTVGNLERGEVVKGVSLRKVIDYLGIEPRAETMRRIYPGDVEHIRDVIGMYVLGKSPEERRVIGDELYRWMIDREARPSGGTKGKDQTSAR